MTIAERIASMVQQYSITKDNPTVLRELMKLSAMVTVMLEWAEEIDPKGDLAATLKGLQDQIDELSGKIAGLDPDAIAQQIAQIQAEVNQAKVQAQNAQTAATEASGKADDLETRLENVTHTVGQLATELAGKQNTLIFDSAPTEGSSNPVTSDGIKKAIDAIPAGETITLDDTVTAESANGVKSSGIYAAINAAKEELNTSINEAKTDAGNAQTAANEAKTAADNAQTTADNKQNRIVLLQTGPIAYPDNSMIKEKNQLDLYSYSFVSNRVLTQVNDDLNDSISGKQNTLTFDSAPTEGSNNPVTSDGIKRAIDAIPAGETITLDDTVTADSTNGVKSSGIYTAIETAKEGLSQSISNMGKTVDAHSGEIAALQEFQQTQETTNQTHNTQIAANIEAINRNSGDIAALETDKMDAKAIDANPAQDSQNLVTSGGVFAAVEAEKEAISAADTKAQNALDGLAEKQNTLTFDSEPTADSTNPVTSGGVYNKINSLKVTKQDLLVMDTETIQTVAPRVAAALTAQPTVDNQLITSKAVWDAIQSMSGGGVSLSISAKNLTFNVGTYRGYEYYLTEPLADDEIPISNLIRIKFDSTKSVFTPMALQDDVLGATHNTLCYSNNNVLYRLSGRLEFTSDRRLAIAKTGPQTPAIITCVPQSGSFGQGAQYNIIPEYVYVTICKLGT